MDISIKNISASQTPVSAANPVFRATLSRSININEYKNLRRIFANAKSKEVFDLAVPQAPGEMLTFSTKTPADLPAATKLITQWLRELSAEEDHFAKIIDDVNRSLAAGTKS